MTYITTAPTTYSCSTYYSNYSVFMIYLATGTKTSLGSLWSQQLLHLTIYIVTATITSLRPHILWSILFQQPSHPYVLSYHSHSYDLMTYSIPATQPPSRPIALQPICYIPTTNATASILRLNNLMLRPIYYVLTISCYSLYIMSLQSNDTAYISRPYNLMLQPIYYVLTITWYSLYITSLQFNATAYILCSYNLMIQPIYHVLTI